jgi:hypothetical protein
MEGPCRLEKTTSVFTAFLTDSCSFCRLDPRWQTGVVCRRSDRRGLTRNVTVPVLAGLLTDTDSYFAALTAYREGDTAPIVRRVSKAAVGAVFNGRELVSEFHAMRAEWNDKVTARSDSPVWQIADLLLSSRAADAG